jgi:hypothetical protein
MCGAIPPSSPHYVFMAWFLVKHRDSFTFTFTLRGSRQWRCVHLVYCRERCELQVLQARSTRRRNKAPAMFDVPFLVLESDSVEISIRMNDRTVAHEIDKKPLNSFLSAPILSRIITPLPRIASL